MSFSDKFAAFEKWDLILWCAWAAMFFVLEGIGLARHKDATLTYLIRASVPRWAIAALCGWLVYHFVVLTQGK